MPNAKRSKSPATSTRVPKKRAVPASTASTSAPKRRAGPALPGLSKPTLFIGSSSEGLQIAKKLQEGLDYTVEATIWHQGAFGLSTGSLESLVAATEKYAFAVLVLTPDDVTTKRDATKNSPRDNVLFELGLFMGALGRHRTFIVYCRDNEIELPSDLAGVTAATFAERVDGNLRAALGPVCSKLEDAIKEAINLHP